MDKPETTLSPSTAVMPVAPTSAMAQAKQSNNRKKMMMMIAGGLILFAAGAGLAVLIMKGTGTPAIATDTTTPPAANSSGTPAPTSAAVDTSTWYSLVDTKGNFSVMYPDTMSAITYGNGDAQVNEKGVGLAPAFGFGVSKFADDKQFYTLDSKMVDSSTLSFADIATARGSIYCAIGNNTCSAVQSQKDFTTASGVKGLEIYYTMVSHTPGSAQTNSQTVGPVYAFDIKAASAGKFRVMFLNFTFNSVQSVDKADVRLAVAQSVKVGDGRDTKVSYRDLITSGVKANVTSGFTETETTTNGVITHVMDMSIDHLTDAVSTYATTVYSLEHYFTNMGWTVADNKVISSTHTTRNLVDPTNSAHKLMFDEDSNSNSLSLKITFTYNVGETVTAK